MPRDRRYSGSRPRLRSARRGYGLGSLLRAQEYRHGRLERQEEAAGFTRTGALDEPVAIQPLLT